MARRSQCSSAGDNPLDPNYLPPHYREEYRLAVDALVEEDVEGYYEFLQRADVVDFLSPPEIAYIQESVQVPKHSSFPEHRFPETGGDGSSDTYWPIHSDLDAPGLDLGWPQLHHFTGPTEVTTLVNPPEPDMPSIKEQARRLIKNAQQVIAIVMDRFTDVDIFADILNAAMRNIAVYVLLDEQNAHHFLTMVSNCRVNLQSIQFLRVRTVPGITYHCRSGKSFKGQMMDRFLLTDCRAVLSGNYSFMWSFEKLHRSMAHLFLGQLVSTFDEEFRILFAQSHPLTAESMPVPMENVGLRQKKQHAGKRAPPFIEPRKFLPPSAAHLDEWERHSYDERMMTDWRMMPHKRQETPVDLFGRYQSQMDPHFDQGHPRTLAMENPAMKRHSFAEGGRHLHPFLQQQGLPDLDSRGRQLHKGQQPSMGPGAETNYTGYDKYWGQDYQSADQYSEPGLPQEMAPSDNFDPVLNYLSSTRNVDFDQTSEKLQPGIDLPFSSSNMRRLSAGQAYMCQTSPPASNTTDDKQFFPEPVPDRKDPMVKRGLRNWRISSYLSAFENPGDEGLPLAPPQAPEPFDEPSNPTQQTAPGGDMPASKIPNVREFKVPALPRASQMQSYVKMQKESSAVTAESKTTPSPSESSSTTEGDKPEEGEPKEPNSSLLRREDSFRRKYNVAVPRSSRLRSSLIFTSLEQNSSQDSKTPAGQQDEDSESEQTKLPFVSQVLSQRRLAAREPFEWSRYMKSATFDNSSLETSKPDDGASRTEKKDPAKDSAENPDSLKAPDVEHTSLSESASGAKPSEGELPKTDRPVKPSTPFFTSPANVDMNDPDNRLMFFKELAAKRKAAKAAEAEKAAEKTGQKKGEVTVKTEDLVPNKGLEKQDPTPTASAEGLLEKHGTAEDGCQKKSTEAAPDMPEKTKKPESGLGTDPSSSKRCESVQTSASTDSEKIELRNMKSAASATASAEPQMDSPGEAQLTTAAEEESQPPAPETETPAEVPSDVHPENSESPTPHSTSQEASSPTAGSPPPSPSHPVAPSPPPTSVSLKTECPHVKCAADSDPDSSSVPSTTSPDQSCAQKDGEKPVEQSEGSSGEGGEVDKGELCSTPTTGVEGGALEPDPKEPSTPTPTQADPPHEHPPSDVTSGTCQTETVSTSELELSAVSQSPPPPEVSEKTQTNSPLSFSSSDTSSPISETPTDSTDVHPLTDSSSSSPAEPRPPNKSPDSSQISSPSPALDIGHQTEGSQESEAAEPAEKKTEESKNKQETVCKGTNEQTEITPDDAAPLSPQSKQPKGRYHSSTANVLSSSNLRDDTKLLLEQISASSQSRSESAKEAPVTDDEKEDEADKNAKREKERRNGSLSRGHTKTSEEREKLLERIQSMRKDKKVYSRFEMAP